MSYVINTELARVVTIAKVHQLAVNVDIIPDDIRAFVFNYGLKQILNDAGSTEKTPDGKLAKAVAKLEALYKGELRKAREPGEAADPVAKEAWRIAGEIVQSGLGRIWKGEFKPVDMAKVKAFAAKYELDLSDMEGFLDAAREIVAKTDRVQAQAKEAVTAKAALADLI